MAGKRVAVLTPEGQFGTVDEADVDKMPEGSRVLSSKEVAQRAVDEAYAKKSTAQKALGVVNTVVGGTLAGPLAIGTDVNAPPTLAAYGAGVKQGMSAGIHDAAMRKLADAVGGKAAGDRYAAQREAETTASPVATAAGELAGMTGGAMLGSGGSAARAIPVAGVSALGEAVEQGVGRSLVGLAERGVAGRAVASAAQMGTRGAVEGSIYNAIQTASDALLKDEPLSTDKIFASMENGVLAGGLGGAALGGAGSLLKSGAKAALQGVGQLAINGSSLRDAAQKASNELAFDALGSTKGQAVKALEHVAGGSEAVGEYVNRIGIKPTADAGGLIGGSLKAGMSGRADQLLEAIQADKAARIADGLQNALRSTPARMSMADQARFGRALYEDMLKDPTRVAGADSFLNRIAREGEAIERSPGFNKLDGTIDAADAFQIRSKLEKQVYELGRMSGSAGDAYKQYLREWDRRSIQALDDAAAQAGKTGLGDEIRHWKREWQLASAAEELAEHGTDRVKLNAGISLRDTLHSGAGAHIGATASGLVGGPVGAMVGGAAGGMAGALVSKGIRERSAAAGAAALGKLADLQALTSMAAKTTTQITAASRGLLTAAPKGALPAPSGTPRVRAQQAMKLVAALQADPEGTTEKIARQTEGIAASSPEIAQALVQRQVQALTFLASKMPVSADPDPIDPHPAPRMTDADAATFARYAWYTEKPARFFTELAAGKITPEGAETAQVLMPRAFAELQERTLDAIATHMARGRSIPFQQRLKIGTMLDIPAVPAQQPGHAQLLQQNVLGSDQQAKKPPAPASTLRASKAITQRSALDVLEANGPGRR